MDVAIEPSQSLLVSLVKSFKQHFLVLLSALVILRFLSRRYISPLRNIPGPFAASCTRWWNAWLTYKGHFEDEQMAIHKQYGTFNIHVTSPSLMVSNIFNNFFSTSTGPVARIGPNEVSFASPNAAKDIVAPGKGFHKPEFYKVFPPPGNPDLFTEIREDKHAKMKRFAVTPYSLASMQQMADRIEETELQLVKNLSSYAQNGSSCDLGNWLHYFAFDVIGKVAFSRNFGFLDTGTDVDGAIKAIDDVQWYDGIIGAVPYMDKYLRLNPLAQYIPGLGMPLLFLTRAALEELEKQKKANSGEKKDLISQLYKAHLENPDDFTEGNVFAIAHGAIGAGADSTASTMQSFFWFILSNPSVYKKLVTEIDEAYLNGKISEMVTWTEAQNLPYFQACLKEAMRLRPAVGLNITRLVPPGGTKIDGKWFPEGTQVSFNGWVVHRDRETFGLDAEVYRPERWLGDKEKMKVMERHMYQFGGGSRLCIGRNLAQLEMNKVLPLLLRTYAFELVHPGKPLEHHSTFFVVQKGLDVYLKKRDVS